MADPILSGDLAAALNAESINEVFEAVRKDITGMLQLASMGSPVLASEGHKFDWMEYRVSATASALTAGVNDSVTTIPVTDGSLFRVGQQAAAKNSDEVMLVTAVSGNNLTVTRGFGGTTAAAIASGVELFVNSTAREENSTLARDGIKQPVLVENFFQTMDTGLEFSRRALAAIQYGDTNSVSFQLAERMRQLTLEMNRALIAGRRASTVVGGNTITTTGGIKFFNDQAGNLKTDAAGAALTLGLINDLSADVKKRGGSVNTVAVGIDRARQLSELVAAKYNSQRLADFVSDEGSVTRLPSDLPLVGDVTNIVIDTNLNDDELFLIDSSKLIIRPMAANNASTDGNWRTLDATQPGQDGASIRVLGDFGLEIRDAETHMARAHNLSTS